MSNKSSEQRSTTGRPTGPPRRAKGQPIRMRGGNRFVKGDSKIDKKKPLIRKLTKKQLIRR